MLAALCTLQRCWAIGFFLQSDSEGERAVTDGQLGRRRWPRRLSCPSSSGGLVSVKVAPKAKNAALEPAIIGPAPVTGSPPAQSASASPGWLAVTVGNFRSLEF